MDGDQKELDRPRQTWEEYICSAPTISSLIQFDAYSIAEELVAVLNDKKKKKDAKRLLIQTLTKITNRYIFISVFIVYRLSVFNV